MPELLAAKISYEHWHRYIFANHFCTKKNVLDIACGEGFGSNFLTKRASFVTGVDISQEVINHATLKYKSDNIRFILSGASSVPFESGTFDVIVSFETLEHLNKQDQLLFMEEMHRVIKQDGILIISTPNKKVYSDDPNYSNPFHLSEFYKDEFRLFLGKYFRNIDIFEQAVIGGSLISRANENSYNVEHIHLQSAGFTPGRGIDMPEKEYMIGVCSQSDLTACYGSILLDDSDFLVNPPLAPAT